MATKYKHEYKTRKKYEINRNVRKLMLEGVKIVDISFTKEGRYFVMRWNDPKAKQTNKSTILSLKEYSLKLKGLTESKGEKEAEEILKAALNKSTKDEIEKWANSEPVFWQKDPQQTLVEIWAEKEEKYASKSELVDLVFSYIQRGATFV